MAAESKFLTYLRKKLKKLQPGASPGADATIDELLKLLRAADQRRRAPAFPAMPSVLLGRQAMAAPQAAGAALGGQQAAGPAARPPTTAAASGSAAIRSGGEDEEGPSDAGCGPAPVSVFG